MRVLLAAALLAGLCAASWAAPSSRALDAATTAVRAGDRENALKYLAVARKERAGAEHRELVALLYAKLKEYAVARSLLGDLIREAPEEPRLRLYLATVYARAGDRGATLAALGEARVRKPNADDRQRMAALYQDMKDYEPARELLDGLLNQSPGNLSVRLDRASLAAQSGDRAEGLKQLAQAGKLAPAPEDRRRMAALYGQLDDHEAARRLQAELLKDKPANASLLYDRAALAVRAGRRDSALASLAEARRRSPTLGDRSRIAALYLELGKDDLARAVLKDAVRDAPRDLHARLDLASLDARRGNRAAALASLSAASGLKPDLQERQRMALIYEDLQEFKTARLLIDDLIAEQPQDPQLRLDRAHFAADAGDAADALAFLAETLKRSPDPDDRRRMAKLYDRLGRREEAGALLDELDKISR